MKKIDNKKKIEERKILEKIYSPSKFTIEDNEPLDFLIIEDNYIFGVEITRLYYNEGFGRLKNKTNYKSELEKGKYIHKDDYNNLKIKSTYIWVPSDNKYHFIFNKVTYTKPTESEFVNIIVEKIKFKNKKFVQYSKTRAEWFELIISDENEYFEYEPKLSKENEQMIIDEVNNSIFKTVYILSKYKGIDLLHVIGEVPKFLLKKTNSVSM